MNKRHASIMLAMLTWSLIMWSVTRWLSPTTRILDLTAPQKSGQATSRIELPKVKSVNELNASFRWIPSLMNELNKKSVIRSEIPWNANDIVRYFIANPQRAYFSHLFRHGGFRVGMEIGVAEARFSEHFLIDNSQLDHWTWYMVDPFPNDVLKARLPVADKTYNVGGQIDSSSLNWYARNIGKNAHKIYFHESAQNPIILKVVGDNSLDFIYFDGLHEYAAVKYELLHYYSKVRPGGVLAGHDYCNKGEKSLNCLGCEDVPICGVYTEYKISKMGQKVSNQNEVVRAVQEFLEKYHPSVVLHHTLENFTRSSLRDDKFDYDLVITTTRNPSWYFVKPA